MTSSHPSDTLLADAPALDAEAPSTEGDESFDRALGALRRRVESALDSWLDGRLARVAAEQPEARELAEEVARLVSGGGKRMRPILVLASYRAFGGRSEDAVLPLALATELLQAYLLIHDDIMDRAELRRGRPTVHAAFRERHRERGYPGDAEHFGRSAALLAGDLAHTWAVELSRPRRPRGQEARPGLEGDTDALAAAFDATCDEVIGGQFLETLLPLEAAADRPRMPTREDLLRVLRLKSGRYSVERPVELGALAAGAPPEAIAPLRAWGEAVGEAFQLQDDILGTFGDPEAVGKSVASDLEEGKFTFLVHHALEAASPEDRRWLLGILGRPGLSDGDLARARRLLEATGALTQVREMVAERRAAARRSLEPLPFDPEHRRLFEGLARTLTERRR